MNKVTCFLSYSHESYNRPLFTRMQNFITQRPDLINYSEREDKSNCSDDTIWNYLHKRISGSTCTILLVTKDLLTFNKWKIGYVKGSFAKSGWIYNEISASLRDWEDNRINGLVCVLCDGISYSNFCSNMPEILKAGDNSKYIVTTTYDEFIVNTRYYIQKALENRKQQIENHKWQIVYNLHA